MYGSRSCVLLGLLICFCTVLAAGPGSRRCSTDDGHDGFCVRYFNCHNGTINEDGAGILTIKTYECPEVNLSVYKCCVLGEINTQSLPKCGVRNKNGIKTRTLGKPGTALLAEFPWSVALFSTDKAQDLQDSNGYFCGGTLIHTNVVLTAAHCFNNRVPEEVRASVGDWNIHETTELMLHQEIGVKKIIKHKEFYDGNKENNVALLILSQPATLAPHKVPICLPKQNSAPDPASICFTAGWGSDVNDIYPSTIMKMKMQIAERGVCQDAHRKSIPNPTYKLHESFICASSTGDRCAADGGAPLICSVPGDNNTFMQYGILSWASGCQAGKLPAIYADVAKFREWIDKQMAEEGFETTFYVHAK